MRKTRIICTLGPASQDAETLQQMIVEGTNISARFNSRSQ
jgi:pyruvate kinase